MKSEAMPPAIFGWVPTGRSITLIGATMALAAGTLCLNVSGPAAFLFTSPLPTLIIVALVIVRIVVGEIRLRRWDDDEYVETPAVMTAVSMKLASLVACGLLVLATLISVAFGYDHWPSLLRATALVGMLSFVLSLLIGIIGNLAIMRTAPRA